MVCIATHSDILIAEVLQAPASPNSLFGAGHSGLFKVLQHFERSIERQGDNLFSGVKDFEMG